MSEIGVEYVGTYAEVVGTDEPIHASGDMGSGEGGTSGSWWLLWSYTVSAGTVTGGFTGVDWAWDVSGNYLRTQFESSQYNNEYTGTTSLDRFLAYLADQNPSSLNEFLGTWPSAAKADFVNENILYNSRYPRCVELRG